ncbi:MAG: acyl-CoA dehydrogenase family protein [Oceanicaulis sp.]
MTFVLNEDEQMLRDSARGFLSEASPVTALRKLRDDRDPVGFSRELWGRMAEMGWTGVLVEEAHGGVEMGYSAAGVILEEIGRTLTASPYLSTAVMGAAALNLAGTDAQKAAWLPKIAVGETVFAFALTSAPATIRKRSLRER